MRYQVNYHDVMATWTITKKAKDFLKLYKSNKYKSKEEDVKCGVEDVVLDCLEKYSKSNK